MRNILIPAAAALMMASAPVLADQAIGLGPQVSIFSLYARGYYFTAPTDFTITGVKSLTAASYGTQNIEVLKINTALTPYDPSVNGDFDAIKSNAFSVLGLYLNNATPGYIATSIVVHTGDIIGILGDRGGATSYASGAPYATSIAGNAVSLYRLGFQDLLSNSPAFDIFTEVPSNSTRYGRISFTYSTGGGGGGTVPEPASWALMIIGFGCIGSALRHRSGLRLPA